MFVNGKHAIDLGGKIYQVAIYRAERKMTVSSFRISIRGFNPSQSSCSRL